jgi:hypothetical protein
MRVWAYTAYTGTLTIGVATPRDQALPSTRFQAATIHEDYAAQVRDILEEYRHIKETTGAFPAAQRIQTYLPIYPLQTGKPLYSFRELKPSGSPRGIDGTWEVMQLRYDFTLDILPAAHMAGVTGKGKERHLEFATEKLFEANGVPTAFIPGEKEIRPGDRTEIDIRVDLGPATARDLIDIPTPA